MKSAASLLLAIAVAFAYPLDGDKRTGIRRLTGYRLIQEGKVKGTARIPPGGMLPESAVRLRLLENKEFDLTARSPRDPVLQKGLEAIFAGRDPSYGIAVVDITDPRNPRFATVRENFKQLPGSVGKLLIATGIFAALKSAYPRTEDRERFLRETARPADDFIISDGKTVPIYNSGDEAVVNRRLAVGDRFNLYEWLDHMLSQSSNAAGSFTWKEALLLHHFGAKYPISTAEEKAFLASTPKTELGREALETLEEPEREAGINTSELRLGTMFTRKAQAAIPGTASYGTPLELMRWLIRMEQGRLVDEWSSLEIKKLLYFSRPRYRYAAAPSLAKAAVYFKSGSFYECSPEPGFQCVQYKGNATNIMNSVAVVEAGRKVYLVTMMSNVLKINSAVEHMTIAGLIEKLIQSIP